MILRVAKQDAAFLYALLEAYEGVLSYSTLESDKSAGYRDIEVSSTPSQKDDLEQIVIALSKEISIQRI
jgi:hypothetical protein